jgi:hypothetical protein
MKGIAGTHSHKGGKNSCSGKGKDKPAEKGRVGPIANTRSNDHKTRTQTKMRPNKGAPK